MKNAKRILLLSVAFFIGNSLHSQTQPVALISGASTSTLANCGTPATPSLCVVGTGVYVWQNAAQGWFQPTPVPAIPTFVSSISINGGTPQSGPVTLTIPTKAALPATSIPLQ